MREVGGKGEGTGNGVPPCPPPHSCNLNESKLKRMLGCIVLRLVTGRLKIHRHKEIKLNIT